MTLLPVLIADARIEYVLQNLISNAIKYRRKNSTPEIHVSATLEGDTWVFAVRDNGIGIDPQYKQVIFQVFHRLHGKDVPGTGVGLALAQKIVETNAGKMWVESEPGVGIHLLLHHSLRGGKWCCEPCCPIIPPTASSGIFRLWGGRPRPRPNPWFGSPLAQNGGRRWRRPRSRGTAPHPDSSSELQGTSH